MKKQLQRDLTLILFFAAILAASVLFRKLAFETARKVADFIGVSILNFEFIGLLAVFYLFIAIGLFIILRKEKKFTIVEGDRNYNLLILAAISFVLHVFISYLLPMSFLDRHFIFILVLSEMSFFSAIFAAVAFFFMNRKNKILFTTVYFVSLFTIIFAVLSWYDVILVKLTVMGASHLTNIFINSSYAFSNSSAATLTAGNFTVSIGTKCAGIESSILFFSIMLLIYIIDSKRIKNKATFMWWVLAGWLVSFILNIKRIMLLMLIGQTHPDFAVNSFHEYSGMVLFLTFMLPYVWLLYKFNMKNN